MHRAIGIGALALMTSCGGGAGEPDADVRPDAGPQPGDVAGLMTFGDVDEDWGLAVTIDGDGNIVVTGFFGGRADLGDGVVTSAGGLDAFVIKQTPDGQPLWERAIGDWWTGGIAVDANAAGDIAVAGFFWDDMNIGTSVLLAQGDRTGFVAKYDSDGSPVWARALGGPLPAWAQVVAIDADGNVFVGGDFEGTADFGAGAVTAVGNTDSFVAKYASADGAPLWSRTFGSANAESTWGMALTTAGAPIIVGWIGGDVDFGCGVHDYKQEDDVYVARLASADGSCVWSRPLSSYGHETAHAVAIDSRDDVIVVGNFADAVDFGDGPIVGGMGGPALYVVKYAAADGAFRWVRRINGPSFESAWAVTTDQNDSIYLTGTYEEVVDFGGGPRRGQAGGDTFVLALNPDGTYQWSQFPVCYGVDFGNGIAADTRTGIVVTGAFEDAITAGPFGADSAGATDAFVMRLLP